MSNKDETSDSCSGLNEIRHRSDYVPSLSLSPSSNSGSNWFRSIPRRIRKFISKQGRHSNKHLDHTSNNFNKFNATANDMTDELDDSNLYSIVDQRNCNDEEVAMLRATAQMARYVNPIKYAVCFK